MKILLSILLINLIFVSSYSLFGKEYDDESEGIITSDKEMQKYAKSIEKMDYYFRYLQEGSTDDGGNDGEDGEATEDTETTDNLTQEPTTQSPEPETTAPQTVPATQPPVPVTQAPQPVPAHNLPQPAGPKRNAAIHVLAYNSFVLTPPRPLVVVPVYTITYSVYIRYIGYTPFPYVSITLKITYRVLRGLQSEEKLDTNATSLCTFNKNDATTQVALYDCEASSTEQPELIQSYNDFKFLEDPNTPANVNPDSDVSLSQGAGEASLSLMNQTSKANVFVILDNGRVFSNDSSVFYVRGKLTGSESDKKTLADQSKLNFTFFDTSSGNGEKVPVNVTCDITNHDEDNFEFRCVPKENLVGSLYESTANINDKILLSLNMAENYDTVSVQQRPTTNNKYFYNKSSSGLSGGAIAGIVIACAVVLIIVTVIAMFLRRRKVPETNNSTIVGLKSVDNY